MDELDQELLKEAIREAFCMFINHEAKYCMRFQEVYANPTNAAIESYLANNAAYGFQNFLQTFGILGLRGPYFQERRHTLVVNFINNFPVDDLVNAYNYINNGVTKSKLAFCLKPIEFIPMDQYVLTATHTINYIDYIAVFNNQFNNHFHRIVTEDFFVDWLNFSIPIFDQITFPLENIQTIMVKRVLDKYLMFQGGFSY